MPRTREIEITPEMREAGAAILGDPDLSFSAEEKAVAVYIAMERSRYHSSATREAR